jgi:hypothetical protein
MFKAAICPSCGGQLQVPDDGYQRVGIRDLTLRVSGSISQYAQSQFFCYKNIKFEKKEKKDLP